MANNNGGKILTIGGLKSRLAQIAAKCTYGYENTSTKYQLTANFIFSMKKITKIVLIVIVFIVVLILSFTKMVEAVLNLILDAFL